MHTTVRIVLCVCLLAVAVTMAAFTLTDLTEASLGSALEMAQAGIRSARLYLVALADGSSDETYRFVVRRENELRLDELRPKAEKLAAWVEARI